MSSSLSSLADNFAEGLHNSKCMDCESCLKYNSIENIKIKDTHLIFKCLKCSKNHKNILIKT